MALFNAKYIVFDSDGIEDMIIFSALQQHADIAAALDLNPVSAGSIDEGQHCFGQSTSLGISSRPEEDRAIARRVFNIDQD